MPIGFSEILLVALLFLLIFGPDKLPKMARELGKFTNDARNAVDEFKNELTVAGDDEPEENPRQSSANQERQSIPDNSREKDEYDL
jgi:Tat protein translocase TatB subunit